RLSTACPAIYTLSLHDALPIFGDGDDTDLVAEGAGGVVDRISAAEGAVAADHEELADVVGAEIHHYALEVFIGGDGARGSEEDLDRKSTRLNSSHVAISYAVFC